MTADNETRNIPSPIEAIMFCICVDAGQINLQFTDMTPDGDHRLIGKCPDCGLMATALFSEEIK